LDQLDKNFGLLIAFGLPGFLVFTQLPPQLMTPLASFMLQNDQPSIGSFLYTLPASIGCGIILSAIRWMLVDSAVYWTGVRKPNLNFRSMDTKLQAFGLLVEHNYRFYQFYSNSLVAILLLVGMRFRIDGRPSPETLFWLSLLCVVLAAASRDCLARFYQRARLVLGELNEPVETNTAKNHAKKKRYR
jgi:hypothetical protein